MINTKNHSIMRITILAIIILLQSVVVFCEGLSITGNWPYSSPNETTVSGNYLFQAKSNIIYVYDKTGLNWINSNTELPVTSEILTIVSSGSALFAACGYEGIYIFDISNPGTGITLTSHYAPSTLYAYADVYADGDTLYSSFGLNATEDNPDTGNTDESAPASPGIEIIDISSPASPAFISRVSIPEPKKNIPAIGVNVTALPSLVILSADNKKYAFSNWGTMLVVYDITLSASPSCKGYKPVFASISDIDADTQYIYLATQGLGIITEVFSSITNEIETDETGFQIFGEKASPVYLCVYNETASIAQSIMNKDSHMFVADSLNGLQVIDISNPLDFNLENYGTSENPNYSYGTQFLKGSYNTDINNAYSISLDTDAAFLSDQGHGLYRFDTSDPALPVMTHTAESRMDISVVGIYGGYILAAGTINNIYSLIVIDILTFRQTATLPLTGQPVSDILVQSTDNDKVYAYLAAGSDGVKIIEVTNETTISNGVVQTLAGDNSQAVFINNNIACIANGSSGVRITDISNPLSPVEKAVINIPDARDVKVKVIEETGKTFLFIAGGTNGLVVYDISDPASPLRAAGSLLPVMAETLAISNNFLYVTDVNATPGAIHAFDVSSPEDLTDVTINDSRKGLWTAAYNDMLSISASDTHLFVASGQNGVVVVDFTDKANPSDLTQYQTGLYAKNISFNASGSLLMAASQKAGVIMYAVDFSEPFVPGPDWDKLFTYDDTPLKIKNDSCFIGSLVH